MRFPQYGDGPLRILSAGVLISAAARGWDFIAAPDNSSVTMSAIGACASPTSLGVLLIALAVLALVGLALQNPPLQAISHIALSTVFLIMGVVSFFPVINELAWGWRAPVSYIFGSAVVHWFLAHTWYNRWVEKRADVTTVP